jgi:hypothetical protein
VVSVTMFCSFVPSLFVGGFINVICICLSIVMFNTYCAVFFWYGVFMWIVFCAVFFCVLFDFVLSFLFVFVLSLAYPMLP